jgi:hypothetical protein
MGYLMLRRLAEDPQETNPMKIARKLDQSVTKYDEAADLLRSMFLEPFYEYLDEHIDDQQAILYFLGRYKQRCEWFHAESLRRAVTDDTLRGEKTLARDLYEYLHSQGIEFHIEPRSASGIPDFLADQVGDDRVIADTKLFWPEKGKGKPYILSGFHQAYTYACDYHEPFAHLVIYKMCSEALNFLTPETAASFPSFTVNNKTIFFVVVDICHHGASASKRGTMRSVDITPEDLVRSIEGQHDVTADAPESADAADVAPE